MQTPIPLFLALLVAPFAIAVPFPLKPRHDAPPPNAKLLYHFSDNNTWIENLVVRANGKLILTTITDNNLYTFDPTVADAVPQIALQVPDNATAVTGIAELFPDQFLIVGGHISASPLGFTNNTFFVVDFSDPLTGPKVTKTLAGHGPVDGLPNGMVALDEVAAPGAALVADSLGGAILRVDTNDGAGTVEVVFTDPALLPSPTQLGVNGLKLFGGYLYFTNTQGQLGRVRVSPDGRTFGDQVEVVAQLAFNTTTFDDFAIDEATGVIYAAVHPNMVERIYPDGRQEVLVGAPDSDTSGLLVFPTSVAFGRRGPGGRKQDPCKLFVTTGGATVDLTAGTETLSGGQIVEVDL